MQKLNIAFGPFTFSFLCSNSEVLDYLTAHFDNHLSDDKPDLFIQLTVLPADKAFLLSKIDRYQYTVNDNAFNFGPDLIYGSWDAARKKCDLHVCDFILTPDEIWLFGRIMCRLFYTLSIEHNAQQEKAFIIHSTGVIKNGLGYLFFGPPGSGKSTIAGLSGKFTVLHDDMNLVTIHDHNASVEGVPFNPKLINRTKAHGPVSAIFSLHKHDAAKIEKRTPAELIEKLLPETFLPLPVLSKNRTQAFQYMISCVRALSNRVPYFRLYFKKDDGFWNLIEKMEDKDGRY